MKHSRLLWALSLGCTVFWSLLTPATYAAEKHLTLLFTNDTHNRLEPFQHVDLNQKVGGIIRRSHYLQKVRQENPLTVLLDAGDVFQGTPYYNFYLGEPDIKGMSYMGYHAMTVGNHDLDNGVSNLKKQMSYANFPVLNANIVDQKTGKGVFKPYYIIEAQGLKIGVIGLMSEHAWQAVSSAHREGYRLLDPFATANKIVPQLRPQVDLIVSLHHMGIWDDEVYPLKVPGVDIVLGGHSHTQMDHAKLIKNKNDNGLGGTLIQHAYYMGVYVGRIDLKLDTESKKVLSYSSDLELMNKSYDAEPIQTMLNTYGDQLKSSMGQRIGESLDNMSTDGKYDGPFALGSLVADILRSTQKTEIGIMNTGGVRSDLPKGPITVGKVYEIMPFDNAITTFEMQGKDLRDVVQTSASRLGVSKNLQFSGLVYTLKDKQVVAITHQGKPLDDKRWYTVAAPTYVYEGNEAIAFDKAREALSSGRFIRDVLIDYVKQHPQIKAPVDQRMIRQ